MSKAKAKASPRYDALRAMRESHFAKMRPVKAQKLVKPASKAAAKAEKVAG